MKNPDTYYDFEDDNYDEDLLDDLLAAKFDEDYARMKDEWSEPR